MSSPTRTEWSIDARTSLGFKVNESAVQARLPDGWRLHPFTAAGSLGVNLTLVFLERLLVLDGQEKVRRTGVSRYLVMSAPVTGPQAPHPGSMIIGGLSPEGVGAYGAYLTATEARVDRTSSSRMEEAGAAEERWLFAGATGERVELQLRFRRTPPVKSRVDAVFRSGINPEFTRTYHMDLITDAVRSLTTEDRVDEIHFHAGGAMFETLFDGTEELITVTSIPAYVRTVDVP